LCADAGGDELNAVACEEAAADPSKPYDEAVEANREALGELRSTLEACDRKAALKATFVNAKFVGSYAKRHPMCNNCSARVAAARDFLLPLGVALTSDVLEAEQN
jgi:hypothetical protein